MGRVCAPAARPGRFAGRRIRDAVQLRAGAHGVGEAREELPARNQPPRLGHGDLAARAPRRLLLAFLALLFVSLVLSSVFTFAERPSAIAEAWAADPSGLVLNPELGRWLPRWLHLVAGALVIGSEWMDGRRASLGE